MRDEEATAPELGGAHGLGDRARTAHPGHPSAEAAAPRAFHPPVYRGVVANWPDEWRERWGRRANELEEGGLCWRDAEAQAFAEVWSLVHRDRRGDDRARAAADPERN